GRIVLLTEDHCTFAPGWRDALAGAVGGEQRVCGGPVDNGAPRSAYDWAPYFFEYGAVLSPLAPAAAVLPSGINVAYPRSALELTRAIWEAAFHENEVHDALRGAGVRFGLVPEARVWSHLGFGFGAAMAHLFAGGRRFAAHRAA